MLVQLLAVQRVPFLFEYQEGPELVRLDLVESDPNAQFQRRPEIDGSPQQQTRFRRLRRIEFVQRAVAAAAAIVGRIGAEPWVTEFLAA
jgi:hypothetical protein